MPPLPQSGGSFVRDPESGKLDKAGDAPAKPAKSAPKKRAEAKVPAKDKDADK